MRRFGLFFIGGMIGFVVDAGVVQGLVSFFGMDPYFGRLISFSCAATVTWLWNRHTTFADARGQHRWHIEWARWMAAMSGGALVNYGVYALAVYESPLVRAWPALGVALGSLAAAAFNYTSARRWVFGGTGNTPKKPP
jgi:putative flippase GtrA